MALTNEVRQLYNTLVGNTATGVRIRNFPFTTENSEESVGTQLKASGNTTGAYKYAANSGNVKAIVAKNTVGSNYKLIGCALNTPSATSIFVIKLGYGAAAGGAFTAVTAKVHMEFATDAGGYVPITFPFAATVVADGSTDGVLGDAASSNAAADDTINCVVFLATGFGS
jgi:hypothetical protein